MAHVGRTTKLTPELSKLIDDLISSGCIINDVCLDVGIDRHTFYNWRNRGRQYQEVLDLDPDYLLNEDERLFLSFFHNITRAQGRANVAATIAVRSAFSGGEEVTESLESTTETRLRTVKKTYLDVINGVEREITVTEQVPYDHTTTRKRRATTKLAPDGRLALDYLARRDSENWARRQYVEITVRERLIGQIQRGEVEYDFVTQLFDAEEASELWNEAGVPLRLSSGDTEEIDN